MRRATTERLRTKARATRRVCCFVTALCAQAGGLAAPRAAPLVPLRALRVAGVGGSAHRRVLDHDQRERRVCTDATPRQHARRGVRSGLAPAQRAPLCDACALRQPRGCCASTHNRAPAYTMISCSLLRMRRNCRSFCAGGATLRRRCGARPPRRGAPAGPGPARATAPKWPAAGSAPRTPTSRTAAGGARLSAAQNERNKT